MFPLISSAYAADAAPAAAPSFIPLILICIIFYFFLIRPQQKRLKEHNQMVNELKKNDVVVTAGGLVGKVVKLHDEDIIHIEVAKSVTLQIVKSTITSVNNRKYHEIAETKAAAPKAKKKTAKK